jgi:FAD/FMN-containing dehydrogenase
MYFRRVDPPADFRQAHSQEGRQLFWSQRHRSLAAFAAVNLAASIIDPDDP